MRRFSGYVVVATMLAAATASVLGAWRYRVAFDASASRPGGHAATACLVHLADAAAGCLDALALASPTDAPTHRRPARLRGGCRSSPASSWAASTVRSCSRCRRWRCSQPLHCRRLRRSTGAAIDWFSVFFFSLCALTIWVIYLAVQTGFPARPAANVARLLPGFEPRFSSLELALGAGGQRRLDCAGVLAHRSQPAPALEEHGAARPAVLRCAGCC